MTIDHRPLAYEVGPLMITGFGLAVLAAFVVAQIVAQNELKRRGYSPEPVGDMIFAAVLGSLVGAKLYFVALTGDIGTLFSRGGFVFWGGLIGGILAVTVLVMRRKLGFWRIADVAGLSIMPAYAVGRTGCWAVGDDYGRPWDGPLAVRFPEGAPPSTAQNMQEMFGIPVPADVPPNTVLAVHPTQLYEVTMAFILFLLLLRLRDHKHAEGWLMGVYCVMAGVERFIVEFFRAKDDRFFGALTVAQVIALVFIAIGIAVMAMRSRVTPEARGIYATA
ncbi:MAG TPA: prolipoprotein diacylglyceryl transferase [Gemmatimonadaceae bacterium]|nr:prolipoprotein diacylglyceryl transferase [Gemmatimonadaceae bacterium]